MGKLREDRDEQRREERERERTRPTRECKKEIARTGITSKWEYLQDHTGPSTNTIVSGNTVLHSIDLSKLEVPSLLLGLLGEALVVLVKHLAESTLGSVAKLV